MDASTTRLQRFLRACVPCLLTANAFALVILATDDPEPIPVEQGTRTVTLIKGADGSTREVDPSTPEGQAAIEEAEREGATITETTVTTPTTVAGSTTTTGLLQPKAATNTTLPKLPITVPTLPVTIPTLPVTVPTIPVTVPTIPVTVPTTIKLPSTTVPTLPPTTVPTIPVTVPTIPVTVPTIPITTPTLPGL